MSFDKQQAQRKLENVLERIRAVNFSIEKDILRYRDRDILVDEADEYKTMRDIRYYLIENYRRIDRILIEELSQYRD